ncbi:hypothetical protein Cgig2_008896 [Carnegiea gigantea]|uniref:Small auxin up regulated protein n=1 Tax=Carnegiea gigantea TaxID=171969 RepID=A0A9Q1QK91_9CARY|nr:hypothetical protein Cgig2_008896 [Carnegiea gigantea]
MMMRRNRGFKLGRRLIRVFKWITRKRGKSCNYQKLDGQKRQRSKAIAKLCAWATLLRCGFFNSGSRGYIRLGNDPVDNSIRFQVPKGYLAVHVGKGEHDTRRVLVPVLFLNHPLLGKLLKEAEEVFEFHHPGRITIPCPISEFDSVMTEIAADEKCRPWIHRHGYVPGIKSLQIHQQIKLNHQTHCFFLLQLIEIDSSIDLATIQDLKSSIDKILDSSINGEWKSDVEQSNSKESLLPSKFRSFWNGPDQ